MEGYWNIIWKRDSLILVFEPACTLGLHARTFNCRKMKNFLTQFIFVISYQMPSQRQLVPIIYIQKSKNNQSASPFGESSEQSDILFWIKQQIRGKSFYLTCHIVVLLYIKSSGCCYYILTVT